MRIVVIALVFAAIILAGGTAYLLNNYLSSREADFASMVPKAPTKSVLVAKADLSIGTVLNDGNTEWVPWPNDAVRPLYFVKTKSSDPLKDMMKEKTLIRHSVSKGDPITKAKVYKSEDPGFLRGALAAGMRAVAVKANPETTSAGFILPGDHVDMLLTHKLVRKAMEQSEETETQPIALDVTTETILENLLVIAIDQKVNEFETGAVLGKTVLLEVTPKQAEIISTAKDMGKLSLVLRAAEAGEPRTEHLYTTDIEVSPLLSSFDGMTAAGNTAGDYEEDIDGISPPGVSALPVAPRPKTLKTPAVAPAPAPIPAPAAPQRKIKVYRGTALPAADEAEDTGDEEVIE
ncbi:Flp pilus assembly protein CpaB [Magnetovibrio sp. PR-2]|uniref:Flp pilus assembly protein CpaB n=1 Tax=Magnetovibrio sp. PR-2 TaxID=3120356 RepID=UPI002FCDE303